MAAPSPDSIKETVEKSANFVDWLAEVLRGKNLVKKLLLLDALLFTVFNPLYFPAFLEGITGKSFVWYPWPFWTTIGLLFVGAIISSLRMKKKQEVAGKEDGRSAIRGLLPFGFADAELFRRLQREENIHECLPALADLEFRFGILCGESGCGKTSFIQAGLWPRLSEQGCRCLYVKFSDLDPLDSIRSALVEQFKISREAVENLDLLTLLDAVSQSDPKPIILLFDQFEQFFVHRKRVKQRKPFVQALASWYLKQPLSRVKILICIREDFTGRLIELQKAMGYSLGPQQSFLLEKFEPEKAAKIFQVIAETANVSFDESFVNEFTKQELASREDGLISPVDIQILAWMIASQKSQEERAFNRASFQKLGGIEGLLERFLSRALEARETESRRQAVIKVLLALTDLDGNARAGVLTLDLVRAKLVGTVSDTEAKESLAWLARADMRLINSTEEGYELAHERLIPALRRIAGKELSTADKANQLLDRRVNEWLGNDRKSRYLLTLREWHTIKKHRASLVWGPQKALKQSLLSETARRWRIRLGCVAGFLLLFSICSIGYVIWLSSEAGQIYQIKNDLLRFSNEINDQQSLKQVVEAFVFSDMHQQAFQVAEGINDEMSKELTLGDIAQAIKQVATARKSTRLFNQAIEAANRIEHFYNGNVLKSIAEAISKEATTKSDAEESAQLINQAVEVVNKIEFPYDRARASKSVALIIAKLDADKSARLLKQAAEAAYRINDPFTEAEILAQIAEAMVTTDEKQAVEIISQAAKVANQVPIQEPPQNPGGIVTPLRVTRGVALHIVALRMAMIAVHEQSAVLLDKAIELADGIKEDPYSRAYALSEVARVTAKIDPKRASRLFNQAAYVANDIPNNDSYTEMLSSIVLTIAETAVAERSEELFNLAIDAAYTFSNKANALKAIARAMTLVAIDKQSNDIIKQAIEVANRIDEVTGGRDDLHYKDYTMVEIVKALATIAADRQSEELLRQAIEMSNRIKDANSKVYALIGIIDAFVHKPIPGVDANQFSDLLKQAVEILNREEADGSFRSAASNDAVDALAKLAEAQESEELLNKAFVLNSADNDFDPALRHVLAEHVAKLAVTKQSVKLLNQAIEFTAGMDFRSADGGPFNVTAQAAAKLGKLKMARDIALANKESKDQARALASVLRAYAELKDPTLARPAEEDHDQSGSRDFLLKSKIYRPEPFQSSQ